jgi:hypothetical protein
MLDLGDRGHPRLGVLEEGFEVDDAKEIAPAAKRSGYSVRPAATM